MESMFLSYLFAITELSQMYFHNVQTLLCHAIKKLDDQDD